MSKRRRRDPRVRGEAECRMLARLRERFCPPAWAFIPQVRNGTGWLKEPRTADAVGMGLWPSRGLELHGFEIKTSREDWLRELRQPAKAEEILQFMDRWWIAVASPDIVAKGELPPTWGLLVPHGSAVRALVEAPCLKPRPMDRPFLAALLRRAQESLIDDEMLKAEYQRGREEEKRQCEPSHKSEMRSLRYEHGRLKDAVAEFEEKSGVKFNEWNGGRIGEAVKLVLDGGLEHHRRELTHVRDEARRVYDLLDKALAEQTQEATT